MKKFIRLLAFVLALMLAGMSCAYAEIAAQAKKSASVYSDEAMTKKIGTLPKSAMVVIEDEDGGVAHITYQGKSGFTALSGLKKIGDGAQSATANCNTRVYEAASTSSRSVTIKKGTKVNLLAVNGICAMVEKNGYIGYTYRSHLDVAGETEIVPEATAKPEKKDEVTYSEFRAVVTADSLAVYKSASTSSKKLGTMKKGVEVTVCAYTDEWACLKKGDQYGFCKRSGLEKATEKVEDPAPTAKPEENAGSETPKEESNPFGSYASAVASGKYSNEQLIYIFLTEEMGFNSAAACGVLANIKAESTFNPTAYNKSGGSYGICQWTGGRFTKLKNFCAEKGFDYKSLTGQLYYLEHELKDGYTKTYNYLKGVDNSGAGAYDAGYYWCYHFEVPANRGSRSVQRGNTAKDTYWPKYN